MSTEDKLHSSWGGEKKPTIKLDLICLVSPLWGMINAQLQIKIVASDHWQQRLGAPAATAGFYGRDIIAGEPCFLLQGKLTWASDTQI